MKNQLRRIGKGFKYTGDVFGVSINSWSVIKFAHPDGRIAVALERRGVIHLDERVYRFENESDYRNWVDEMHYGDGRYLHQHDAGLIARAYPVFMNSGSELE